MSQQQSRTVAQTDGDRTDAISAGEPHGFGRGWIYGRGTELVARPTDLWGKARHSFDWGLPVLVLLLAGIRMLRFTNTWAVNVLTLDQWDYMTPLFRGQTDWWTLWNYKHGPHRQGLGYLLTSWVFSLTDWNSRAEAFMNCFLLILAAGLLLWLKARLFGRLRWYDAVLPMFVLTPLQMDHLMITTNPSHSVVPLVLVLSLMHTWISRPLWLKYGGSALVLFPATFTGFSLFTAPVMMGVFAVGIFRAIRHRRWTEIAWGVGALAAAVGIVALFMHGYVVDPAVPGWTFPAPNWQLYPSFSAIAVGNLLLHGMADRVKLEAGGWVVLAVVFLALGRHVFNGLVRSARSGSEQCDRRIDDVIVFLAAFGLAFVANMAVGRLILGLEAGKADRYYALLCTLYFSVYFAGMAWRGSGRRVAMATVFIACALNLCVFIDRADQSNIIFFSTSKKAFVQHLLQDRERR